MTLFMAMNFVQILGLALGIISIMLLVRSDRTEIQHNMLIFMIAVFIQNAAFFLEMHSVSMDAAMVATKIEYLCSGWVVLFFCKFIYAFCGYKAPKWLYKILAAINIICILMVWSCEFNNLFYSKISYVSDGLHPHLKFVYGPFFYINFACSLIIPYLFSLGALIGAYRRERRTKTKKYYGVYIFVSAIPPMTLLLYVLGVLKGLDIAPTVLLYCLSIVVIFFWSKSNYDLTNVATATFIQEVDDSIIILDEYRKIKHFNPAANRLFSFLSDNYLGTYINDLPGFPMELFDSDNARWEFNLNEKYYDSRIKEMYDKEHRLRGYAITIFDITEKQQYLEEIDTMRKVAETANIAKNDFIANMSHEIRTPMNAIVGLSELIKEESRGRKVYNFACDIANASNNLLGIISSILDISTLEAGKMNVEPEDFSPREVFSNIRSTMNVVASQNGLEFKEEIADKFPKKLNGDINKIQQILMNIFNNAVKFTEKGYVKFSVDFNSNSDSEGILTFAVEDTGIGMHKEDMQHIFESFSQVNSNRVRTAEGTGLGLSISQKLAELMNGKISVESKFGTGSKFTCSIPLTIIDATVDVKKKGKGSEDSDKVFTVKDCRVLVVDDNKINRKVALGMLKPYGFELMGAESGMEALELVEKYKFDIIFMDHMMPEMDGVETTRRIREEYGENGRYPVIIALTANAMDRGKDLFLNNGFEDFLPKPVDRRVMHQMLSKWIEDDRKISVTDNTVDKSISLDDISGVFIKGISIVDALENHTGTLDDYLEILKLFYMEGMSKIGYFEELVEREDWTNYRIEVHGLKGAAANIGALELSQEAKVHEVAATENNSQYIVDNFEVLIDMYKTLLDEIKNVLDKQKRLNDINTEREEIDNEELKIRVDKALAYIANFRSKECQKEISELLEFELSAEIRKVLEEVEFDLKMYKDDEAEELLGKTAELLDK